MALYCFWTPGYPLKSRSTASAQLSSYAHWFYRHTDKHLRLVMGAVALCREIVDWRTDRLTVPRTLSLGFMVDNNVWRDTNWPRKIWNVRLRTPALSGKMSNEWRNVFGKPEYESDLLVVTNMYTYISTYVWFIRCFTTSLLPVPSHDLPGFWSQSP